jgi:Skp family chaperone for outer membrane proteins
MTLKAVFFACAVAIGASMPAAAQQLGQVVSPILTVDREALFEQSEFGQRVSAGLEAESARLSAETREIEQALEAEERRLTEQRDTMTAAEFREAADAFDEKVVQLRSDRDAAQAEFLNRLESAQRDFYNRIGPVLGQIMQQRGAVVLLDKRSVLLAINGIDVTQDAIEAIDGSLGDGTAETPAPDPETVPEDGTLAPQ